MHLHRRVGILFACKDVRFEQCVLEKLGKANFMFGVGDTHKRAGGGCRRTMTATVPVMSVSAATASRVRFDASISLRTRSVGESDAARFRLAPAPKYRESISLSLKCVPGACDITRRMTNVEDKASVDL